MSWTEDEIAEFMEKHSTTNWRQDMVQQMMRDLETASDRDEAIERAMHMNVLGDVWVVVCPE